MGCTISRSLLATAYWFRDKDGTGRPKFLLKSALECPYV